MIKRHLQSVLTRTADMFPVISLTGPRQSGKTTLAKTAFADAHYVSLEEPANRSLAIEDAKGFLQTINTEFFKGIEYWRKLTGAPDSPAALIYGGDRKSIFKGTTVLPWFTI